MDNNVIMVRPKNVTHNLCPFLDMRPGVPANERWKAVGGTGSLGGCSGSYRRTASAGSPCRTSR